MKDFGSKEERRRIALRMTHEIRVASFLGKRAINGKGRVAAYRAKASKLSVALLHFDDFFALEQVERSSKFGAIALVRLADGTGAHVPLSVLTASARLRLRQTLIALLDASSRLADDSISLIAKNKDAA